MRKPSVEEIRVIISDYWNENWRDIEDGRVDFHEAAVDIFNLFNPVLKPLSDLANDEESCRKIAECVGVEYREILDIGDLRFTIKGSHEVGEASIHIWNDGDIFYDINGEDQGIECPFVLVDLIRSLGYDFIPETK